MLSHDLAEKTEVECLLEVLLVALSLHPVVSVDVVDQYVQNGAALVIRAPDTTRKNLGAALGALFASSVQLFETLLAKLVEARPHRHRLLENVEADAAHEEVLKRLYVDRFFPRLLTTCFLCRLL